MGPQLDLLHPIGQFNGGTNFGGLLGERGTTPYENISQRVLAFSIKWDKIFRFILFQLDRADRAIYEQKQKQLKSAVAPNGHEGGRGVGDGEDMGAFGSTQ
jgi:hypothetical protein